MVIIILSGYTDFKYAQGTVEIGALSYLVEHQVTPQSLLATPGGDASLPRRASAAIL